MSQDDINRVVSTANSIKQGKPLHLNPVNTVVGRPMSDLIKAGYIYRKILNNQI